ncbi:hypothetical protein [Alteromonas sp. ASW11-130]|uniref:hypothetical protein n=1 Tax=Alteromonas sp. ASW11-130 TaxID=3015775 RepID=UPI0022426A55|nr:hypothetical protein [Alteromonas sp. ASW11-130]MCW8090513.1 hypothetical protein [Alteromonas sp. ASW11-130]
MKLNLRIIIPLRLVVPFIAVIISLPAKVFAESYRLPDNISVTKQSVYLTITPGESTFTGRTSLELLMDSPRDTIVYHSHG